MNAGRHRGTVVWVIPLILSLVVVRRAAETVRTVDFLQIFMCGMIVGISLINMIQYFKRGSAPKS